MKIAILDAKTLGDDIDLAGLESLGEVVSYSATAPNETAPRLAGVECKRIGCGGSSEVGMCCRNRI